MTFFKTASPAQAQHLMSIIAGPTNRPINSWGTPKLGPIFRIYNGAGIQSLAVKDKTLIIPRGRGTIATITFEAKKSPAQTTVGINQAKTLIASSSTRGKSILGDIRETVISIR